MTESEHNKQAFLKEGTSPEEAELEEQALSVSGEGDSPTQDDRVGTLEHVEDFPTTLPEGAKPASLEDILRKEREAKEAQSAGE